MDFCLNGHYMKPNHQKGLCESNKIVSFFSTNKNVEMGFSPFCCFFVFLHNVTNTYFAYQKIMNKIWSKKKEKNT